MSDQELQQAMQSVRTSPDNPANWRNLAALLRAKGEVTKADDCDQQVQKLLGLQIQSVIESRPIQTTQHVQQIHNITSSPLLDKPSTGIKNFTNPSPLRKTMRDKYLMVILGALAVMSIFLGVAFFAKDTLFPKNTNIGAYEFCKQIARDQLKSPSTAIFPSISDPEFKSPLTRQSRPAVLITPHTANQWLIVFYVDSQNNFGAMIRTELQCKTSYSSDKQFTGTVQSLESAINEVNEIFDKINKDLEKDLEK